MIPVQRGKPLKQAQPAHPDHTGFNTTVLGLHINGSNMDILATQQKPAFLL